MYKTILVPLDGSKRAEAILPHVENLALSLNAKVILFMVEEPVLMLGYDEIVDMSKYHEERDHKKKQIGSYLASVQKDFRAKGIAVQTLIGHGSVTKAIIDAAEQENAGLVAMASHGHGALFRTFYGSVVAGVLQRIDRPLFLIRSRRSG
ncbi:MAG: universal stress protein [Thermodesulfobacteriota bacterium]|nr:universal stress protein [Thermodesulfobacteriota bacterium]